jgi:N utilization substance protein A
VVNALAPAEISRVVVDEVNHNMEVIVADDMLSLAIGRRGQNVRLASKLTGWRIDVKSESKYGESLRDGYRSLLDVVGVGEVRADVLFQAGYGSAEALAEADPGDLAALPDISEERAEQLVADARRYLAEGPQLPSEEADELPAESEALAEADDLPAETAEPLPAESEALAEADDLPAETAEPLPAESEALAEADEPPAEADEPLPAGEEPEGEKA